MLRAHRKRQAEEQLAFGPGYLESELVFRREDGSPVVPQLFSLAFKKAVRDAKLPAIRLQCRSLPHRCLWRPASARTQCPIPR